MTTLDTLESLTWREFASWLAVFAPGFYVSTELLEALVAVGMPVSFVFLGGLAFAVFMGELVHRFADSYPDGSSDGLEDDGGASP